MSKLVPKIRFRGFTDEWKTSKLSDLATFSKGKGYSKSDLTTEGTPIIHYGRMYTNYETQIDTINDTFISESYGAVLSQKGDVIVPGSGETPEDIARASNVNLTGIVLGGDINIVRPDTQQLDSTFLALTISNGQQQKELIKRAQGKSIVHLHTIDLKQVKLMVPKLREQTKIGDLFEKLENLITSRQKQLDLLKEQKKGFLQKMFPKAGETVPEIRFAGFVDDWEKYKLGELGKVAMNKRIFKDETSAEGEVPFFKIGTFGGKPDAFISRELFEKYKSKYPFPKTGDLLISASGSIGKVVEYTGKDEYYQDSNIIWINHDSRIDNSFLKQFYNIVKWEGLEGSTIKRLYNKNILSTKMSVPEVSEQCSIGKLFKDLDNMAMYHQRQLDLLKELKRGFLQQMFI